MNEEILAEALPKTSSVFTIDPYTDLDTYNQSLMALDNNKIDYAEWISTINPFNFYLSLEKSQYPIMINYDIITKTEWKNVVSKVKPLRNNDIYVLYRRLDKTSNIGPWINNDVFRRAFKSSTNIIFQGRNKEQIMNLSKSYGPIYPLGSYINGSKRLFICFNSEIKNMISPQDILLEMGKHKTGALELAINYKVLRNQDKIEKWTDTPKFENGKYYPTSPTSPLKMF